VGLWGGGGWIDGLGGALFIFGLVRGGVFVWGVFLFGGLGGGWWVGGFY